MIMGDLMKRKLVLSLARSCVRHHVARSHCHVKKLARDGRCQAHKVALLGRDHVISAVFFVALGHSSSLTGGVHPGRHDFPVVPDLLLAVMTSKYPSVDDLHRLLRLDGSRVECLAGGSARPRLGHG